MPWALIATATVLSFVLTAEKLLNGYTGGLIFALYAVASALFLFGLISDYIKNKKSVGITIVIIMAAIAVFAGIWTLISGLNLATMYEKLAILRDEIDALTDGIFIGLPNQLLLEKINAYLSLDGKISDTELVVRIITITASAIIIILDILRINMENKLLSKRNKDENH